MGQNRLTTNVVDPQIRDRWRADAQREWTEDAKVAAGPRWGPVDIAAQRNVTITLLDTAQLTPGLRIVDVGRAGGDPGLAAAARVGPTGSVAVTDISPGMLETARQLGRQHGLTNITYHVADVERRPFDDRSFDRALCRCAVMFFPDHDAARREIRRVLLPGGRAAFLAWGPRSDNPLFSNVFAAIGTVLSPPQPPSGAPSPFSRVPDRRCHRVSTHERSGHRRATPGIAGRSPALLASTVRPPHARQEARRSSPDPST